MADETDEQRDARLRNQLYVDLFKNAAKDPENGKIGELFESVFDYDKGIPY